MQKPSFLYLFFGLLVLLFAVPAADDLGMQGTPFFMAIVFSALLLIGIWSLRGGGYLYYLGMAFVIIGTLFNIVAIERSSMLLEYGTILSLIGFLLVATLFALKQVLFGTEINANRLVGAVCVFLMMGVLWAFAYTLLEMLTPGSFKGLTTTSQTGWSSGWLYFSFVTLTTLGYGDISPVSALARTFAFMQVVVGQFYIAVLVAGLVSAYIAQQRGD